MNKDKLTNDTTSGKTQSAPIKVAKPSDGVEGNNNPAPEGDSSSDDVNASILMGALNAPSAPDKGSRRPDDKGDNPEPNNPQKGQKTATDSAPISSEKPSHKGK